MVIEEIEMGRATSKLICETLEMDPKTLRRRLRGEESMKRRQRPCPSQERIRERLKVLAEAHPHWGVRRLWALLRREGVKVSRKTVHAALRSMGYTLPVAQKEAKRRVGKKPEAATGPNQVWQIDLTSIPTLREGWGYLFTVIDTFDRAILASDLFGRCRTQEALAVLGEALNKAFPEGAKGRGLRLVHDNGSQFTSRRFREFVKSLEIEDIRTAYRHPQSLGILEAWHKTLKVEEVYPKEYETLAEARASIRAWVERYNHAHLHSALAYLTPMEYGVESLGVLA